MTVGATILAILYAAPQHFAADDASTAIEVRDLGSPFETTLEEGLAAIECEPRGYVELDGSFSLHATSTLRDEDADGQAASARIDGEIYDFDVAGIGSRIHHVDVRGPAVAGLWRTVFDALSPRGAEGVAAFLPETGEVLSGEAFLARLMATSPPASE